MMRTWFNDLKYYITLQVCLGLIGCSVVVALGYYVWRQETQVISSKTESVGQQFAVKVQREIETQFLNLLNFSKRWSENDGVDAKVWLSQMRSTYNYFSFVESMYLVDPKSQVIAHLPQREEFAKQYLKITEDEPFKRALNTRLPRISDIYLSSSQDYYYTYYLPILVGEEIQSIMVIYINLSKALHKVIKSTLPEGFILEVFERERLISQSSTIDFKIEQQDIYVQKMIFPWATWELKVMPLPLYKSKLLSNIPFMILLCGLALLAMLMICLHLVYVSLNRLQQINSLNVKLDSENKVRKSYENKLYQVNLEREATNRAKSTFLSQMSHQIRTPLNSVIGYTQMLIYADLKPSQKKMVEAIDVAASQLLDIVDDVLKISILDLGDMKYEPSPFNLNDLVDHLANFAEEKCNDKNVEFRLKYAFNINKNIEGDHVKLKQILIGLFSNAIRFTDKGEITLELEKKGNNYTFKVQDTGVGFDTAKLEEIYEPFKKVRDYNHRSVTSLGLAICKRQVEILGGELHCQSEIGAGTTFSFTVPMNDSAKLVKPKTNQFSSDRLKVPADQTINVLIADDMISERELLKHILESANFRVEEAVDGFEVLDKLKLAKFDCILLDLRMPHMDGFETIKAIRDHQSWFTIPCVAVSAYGEPPGVDIKKTFGFSAYITKPYKIKILYQTLGHLLDIHYIEEHAVPLKKEQKPKSPIKLEQFELSNIVIPLRLKDKLKIALEKQVITDVKKTMKLIADSGGLGRQFAAHCKVLVKNFDFKKILAALGEVKSE